jgi:sulfate adenylyltransferase
VANIAPFVDDRKYNKNLISKNGNYYQIWVNTTLEECENRDVKGLYKLARQGKIKQFTGISDPFEDPTESYLIIDGNQDINNLIDIIISNLREKKYL